MSISNEEMEVLNRASEILSKYAAQGGLSRADFDYYEKMVIAIIDEQGINRDGKISDERNTLIKHLTQVLKIIVQRENKLLPPPNTTAANNQDVIIQSPNVTWNKKATVPMNLANTEEKSLNNPGENSTLQKSEPVQSGTNYLIYGSYSEDLNTGGCLKISNGRWSIEYYFPGPDRRYKGTFVSIPSSQIDQYIEAWKNNLKKYFELQRTVKNGQNFQMIGEMGMTIGVGGFLDGVSLRSYHMRAKTIKDIADIIKDYNYARNRATHILSEAKI